MKVGAPLTDITAGILGAMGILAAIHARAATGKGQRVDTSLFEAGIVHTYWQSAIAFATGVAPAPLGTAHPLNAPYQAFRVADGWITVGAANQANWLRLAEALEAPELARDPRFADNASRMANVKALEAALAPHFARRAAADWLKRLEAAGVPAGPVLDINEMHRDAQTLARAMVVTVDHPTAGAVKTLGPPVKFSETPGAVVRAAPTFGQHSREILAEHGFSPEEIERLIADGAVAAG
jgi:crotonobetainyl-CoA:carnitine CoA-transferase CaiB-like acyl-CoA transferase